MIVTSRVALSVYGEHEYPVPALALPSPQIGLDPVQLMQSEAVLLFVMRLRQHTPGFNLTSENARAVIEICRRMGGLPLALELAAVAVRSLPVEQLAAILSDDNGPFWIGLLKTPSRDLPQRQRTLYHAIAWSYRLLNEAAQRVLRCLSVFAGDFDTEAAQAVCGPEAGPLLESLADGYLLARAQAASMPRWFLLEAIREFGWEELNPLERQAVQDRHAAYFEQSAHTLVSHGLVSENARFFQLNAQNLHAALKWALQSQNAALAFKLADSLTWLWETQGYVCEGLAYIPALIQMKGEVDLPLRIGVIAWRCKSGLDAARF